MTCSVSDCARDALKRGLCNAHYLRWWKYGDPQAGRTYKGEVLAWLDSVPLDATDECVPFPYSRSPAGYGQVRVDGRLILASRYICERAHGTPPTPQHEAAHSCGKGHEGCVNGRHLRWATHKENHADRATHGTDARSIHVRNGFVERTCRIEGCGARYKAKGFCVSHYYRVYKTGSPV